MIGAIIGDIVGSRFERFNLKSKEFDFFNHKCRFTDDSVMSLAVANAVLDCDDNYEVLGEKTVVNMQKYGKEYPRVGYGGMFLRWIATNNPSPYNSFGNGAAMRVSACAYAAQSLDEAKQLSRRVTEVTHNHPEGIKGAEAVTVAIFMALEGKSSHEIKKYINKNYYPMNFTIDGIRDQYHFDVTCQGSVPQAIMAFLESENFEDAIRNAISIGGDSDTIAAITGSIAEAYYGVPSDLRKVALTFLDETLIWVLHRFEERFDIRLQKNR